LYPRNMPRLLDVFVWPAFDLLIWGFLSFYLQKLNLSTLNFVAILLGAIIFWELLQRSQQAVSIAFMEDIWEKNLLNLFVTPVRVSEFLFSTIFLGIIRVVIQAVILAIMALVFYHFNIFQFGLYTIPFVISLLLFGWVLGVFTTAIILRYGTNATSLAFMIIILIQPFAAVFYPVAALPLFLRWVAYVLPPSYVFEGLRSVVATGTMPVSTLVISLGLNVIYMVLVFWMFNGVFKMVKRRGLLLKLES
jgi:ABC-2 type transport system permease protein